MEIEKIYQKKSQLEHILLRPDTYIGSVELLQQEMWIWDFENEKMIKKEISFVPGLYKIFDEILVNAADNKQRDKNMSLIRINIDKENNTIKVYNNGRGIPVVEHKEEKVLVPTLIFGHLLTSSNYNDDEKKVTGGRNGYGAKLCNIFSKKFILETSTKETKKSFKQVWTNNMSKAEEPILKEAKDEDFTCVTFVPDLAKFKMDRLDDDTVALLARRAYDIAASTPGVKVYLNDKRLPVTKFEDYCKLYLSNELDDVGNPVKLTYERMHERWEVAVACSDMGFQQVSFVNSIATTKGGRHVDHVVDQLVKSIGELVNKKNKKATEVKPFQIKNHMWVFVNCLIENPTFDSQTKENMTLQVKNFGSKCPISEDFIKKLSKSGLVEKINNWLAFKEKTDLEKAGSKSKVTKIKGIPKLDDANDAGTKESLNCTLIVTEGDSAKTLAVAGLGVIGRDKYGVFPLRGKMLNVREASTKQIIDNAEISNLLKIIGLNFKEKYETKESLKQLRYGKLMIMTDQDHDGSHIKGLLINFVHHQWPNLLKHGFVEEFITPIVKVSKGNQEKSFYSMPEFEEWQMNTDNWNTWKIKYYKGLGTSTSKEAKEYFSDMQRHRIRFGYSNMRDDLAIQLAFSKKFIEERKDWLSRFMEERKQRREQNSAEDYLYQKDTKQITFSDFINKELVLFSNLDNERSIPSLVDGFKPGQRKVLFSCFKRNLVKELKVAQLAGSVAELSAYHHGEQSLMSTIINLAQNFVGSNNINLLLPIGQFGTRLHGGKDSASPRYIFTALNPLTRLMFNPKDDPLFNYINDDGLKVEPDWYCPIIPSVLVNGAEGIGTGWSTKVPNYNPREIIRNLKLMINGEEPTPMKPFYKNFRGKIDVLDDYRVVTNGEIALIGENTVEITELPIGVWTQAYKENVLEAMLHGTDKEKNPQPIITDYKEYHTDTTVRFVVKFNNEQFQSANKMGLHKFFKLQKTISLNSMVLFDHTGCLRRYDSTREILREYFTVRSALYKKRKEYLEGMLGSESCKLDNMARFIVEKIEGKIKVENMKRVDIIKLLKSRNYDPDPVLKWKQRIMRDDGHESNDLNEAEQEEETAGGSDEKKYFDYLLGMPIWNLTLEKKEEILKQQKAKGDELAALKAKSANQLWLDDLEHFLSELDKYEAKEREEESVSQLKAFKASLKEKGNSGRAKAAVFTKSTKLEYLPCEEGERVEPEIDQALLSKAGKESETVKKELKKEANKELNIVDIITQTSEEARKLNDEEIAQFAQKLAKGPVKVKAEPVKKGKVKEEKVDQDDEDAITLDDDQCVSTKSAKPKAAASKPKKSPKAAKDPKNTINKYFNKKKKSDSESDEESIMSVDSDGSFDEPIERKPARARKEVKYDDDESTKSDTEMKKKKKKDDDSFLVEDSDEDEEFGAKSKKKKPSPKQEKKLASIFKPKDNTAAKEKNDDVIKPAKKTTSKKVKSGDEEDTENRPVKKKLTETKSSAKLGAPSAKKTKKIESDSEVEELNGDSDSDYEKPVKSKAAPKKKLMDKNDSYDIFKKAAASKAKKVVKDDDLYEIDD